MDDTKDDSMIKLYSSPQRGSFFKKLNFKCDKQNDNEMLLSHSPLNE